MNNYSYYKKFGSFFQPCICKKKCDPCIEPCDPCKPCEENCQKKCGGTCKKCTSIKDKIPMIYIGEDNKPTYVIPKPKILDCEPVNVNANFTVKAIFEALRCTDKEFNKCFEDFNINLMPPSHYNIQSNLANGGINITSDNTGTDFNCQQNGPVDQCTKKNRNGFNVYKVAAKIPIAIYYNASIQNIKTNLTQSDLRTLILNNRNTGFICTGAYKGFTKEALSKFTCLSLMETITFGLEDLFIFDFPVCNQIISRFKSKEKRYICLPYLLIQLGIINTDANSKLATVNTKNVCDPDYEIYISGLEIEFKNIASDKTKRVACFLAKALREFFKAPVPECV